MLRLITRRLMSAVPTLFIVITVAFFMMRVAPGGPFDEEKPLPPEIKANILKAYGLDKPLWSQYWGYLKNLATGDLGPSYRSHEFSVGDYIASGLPATLQLGFAALVFSVFLGVVIGSVAALYHRTSLDHGLMALSMVGLAIPNFVIAPVLTLVLGVYLSWLPVGGWGNGAMSHKVLPVVALALPQIAYVARLMRVGMIETLGADYIRTAHAKGLPQRLIICRHAIRVAVLPVVSYLGPLATSLLTGSLVVEQIFDLPGIGRHFVDGALNRDYPIVMGVVIVYATLIILFNFIVDIAYGLLDPRIADAEAHTK